MTTESNTSKDTLSSQSVTVRPSAAGWTCSLCGGFVPNGCTHSCPTSVLPQAGRTAVGQANPYELTLQRIAVALERIAAALEDDRVPLEGHDR